ncbi:PepSY-associated TM helix domain-containing protein [Paraflavitalea sp. CAU 1676]|uniref:PepSY-associated TM helix domain-containing protein n=1 Tax=Paraflavitalea sp. CAU 1676 TaxID=3032598 RepID=UPI0023DA0747|nr:PepSY-associated TM helix domain-containing protein [Paraflavitalea sp. CAU 1676]MDF2190003.1 PepSY-associated TM helix domain-containing protein [Paraflavitalea sp. CAU 1676]
MSIKKIIGKVHLWLGLTSGLLVVIISLTGCIYAFQEEIQNMTQPYRFVEASDKPYLAPSTLRAIAEKELPGKHIHSVGYADRTDAARVSFYAFEPVEYYYIVYINPYTGQVLKAKDMNDDFFRWILDGHFYLWLPPTIGQPVVATATLVFVVMMITGIVLWWPRNKAARKQRFSVKWNARWRRVNYDLHNVFGFYMTWVVIFIALTGLVWGFQWFAKGAYWAIGGEKSIVYTEPLSDTTKVSAYQQPVDALWNQLKQEQVAGGSLEMHFPASDTSTIEAALNADKNTYWQTDYRFYDQYTLQEVPANHIWGRINQATTADKIYRMNYDIHTGAVLGLTGKFLAFFASLIAASLPITGFMIWWGRKKKQSGSAAKSKKASGVSPTGVNQQQPAAI